MDSGGEWFSSLISRLDSDQSKLPEQKPAVRLGSGSSEDDEGFQDCEQKMTEDRGGVSQGSSEAGQETRRELNGLLVGGTNGTNPAAGRLAQRNNSTRAPAKPTEAPPVPGTSSPEGAENELPIMNWEALENHIAGLQLRENEKQARERCRNPTVATDQSPLGRRKMDGGHRFTSWERADSSRWQTTGFSCTSRFHSRVNLQLCFINESSSESDTEEPVKGASATPPPQVAADEDGPTKGSLLSRKKELESEAKRGLALVKRQLDLERQKQQVRAASERASTPN
ncbi:schwannomin-interacting protein 1-like isoform X2 [Heterodontus francisci]|uniref:schwannomin-interacting protein 1-like isoform X2 n=1 Tax=Heterodontus francisci TaxID=7792 RepID=UPI00355BA2F6